jgi:hypothetical protein
MKRFTAILALMTLVAGSAVAGSPTVITDGSLGPLSMKIGEAYPLAVKALGTNASQYHCMEAGAAMDSSYQTNHLSGEWLFKFVNTNHEHMYVYVFYDDKTAAIINSLGN